MAEEQRSVAEITEEIGELFDGTAESEEVVEELTEDAEPEDEAASEDDTDGDPDGEPPTEDAAPPTEDVVEIEVDGELLEVPVKYKDHFLRQQDYTTKTQEVASQRKEVEVLQGQVEQTRQQFEFAQSIQVDISKAQQLEAQADQYHEHLKANIDTLSSTDVTKLQLAIQDARTERDAIVSTLQTKQGKFQQAQEQSRSELLTKGTEVLKSKIPGWGETQQKQVRDYAIASGFTEAELSQVVDPRQVETLWKAAQYDALKAGAAPAVKKVQDAPTIKTKARNPMSKETRNKLDLRNKLKSKNLSQRDKQSLIADDIGSRWG